MEKINREINQNHHASVVEIAGIGILIRGESGSGKSSLALSIIEYFASGSIKATLVADDQVFLKNDVGGRLIAKTPDAIAGKLELFGFGIIETAYKEATTIGLIVELVDQAQIERMPEAHSDKILNTTVPLLFVPKQHEQQSVRIIAAWIKKHTSI